MADYKSKHTGAEIDAGIDAAKAALPARGGTMTGALILHGNPSANLGAATKQYVDSAISGIELTPGADGEDGATFTPSVSSDGVLSWTNDKGLTNPDSVNIKGEKGDTGDTGAQGESGADGVSCTHSWNGTILTVSSASGTSSANLKGEQGIQGENGTDGVSPTVSTGKITGGHRVTITDANGSQSFDVMDGKDGADGDGGDGSGDMLKSIYDADGDGVVDNAAKLGGKSPDSYAAAVHTHTKADIGLGNVPNVATNDQTPTYSDTTTLQTLSSGEKLNVAFQKIKCAITNLINHLNNKSNPHGVTVSQIGAATSGHGHALTDSNISGVLPLAKGGTGITSNPSMLVDLGSTSAASVFATSPRPGVTGTLPIANGGTGANSAAGARALLNIPTRTLLWENPNITAKMAVDTQINLSSGDYDELQIYYVQTTTGASGATGPLALMSQATLKGNNAILLAGQYASDTVRFWYRFLNYSTDTAYILKSPTGFTKDAILSGANYADICVPFKIYGIKY